MASQQTAEKPNKNDKESGTKEDNQALFKASFEKSSLMKALTACGFAGAQIDDQGNRRDSFLTLTGQPEKNRVLVRASGSGATITSSADVKTVSDASVTVEAKRLIEIVKVAQEGDVSITDEGKKSVALVTADGKCRLHLREQIIEARSEDPDGESVTIPVDVIRDAIRRVQHAMAKRDVRSYLTGACIDLKANELRIVTSNGQRIALEKMPMPAAKGVSGVQAVITASTLDSISRLLSGHEENVRIALSDKAICVSVVEEDGLAAANLSSPVMSNQFFDYEKSVPTNANDPSIVVGYDELRRVCDYMEAVNSVYTGLRAASFSISGNGVHVTSGQDREGTTELCCGVSMGDSSTETFSVGVNTDYLSKLVSVIPPAGSVTIKFFQQQAKANGSQRGSLVESDEAPWFTEVLAPVKL